MNSSSDSKYRGAFLRPGQDDRQRLMEIVRMREQAQQVEDLFSGTHATGKDHDAVRKAHERFEPVFPCPA